MRHRLIVVLCFLTLVIPSVAQADWLLTPFAGLTFGADTGTEKGVYGVSLSSMGAGVFGFELDFGYSPGFFDPKEESFEFIGDNNVTTLMGNLVVGIPIGGQAGAGLRPYVVGGAGLLRTKVDDPADLFSVSNNDFGVDVGGGVIGFFSDNIGLRGEVRYFRNLTDPEEDNEFDIDFGGFDFWRGTVGVVFRF